MFKDSLGVGVDFGGLINKNDIKILICYILKSVNAPLSGNDIVEILQLKSLANYFEATDAMRNLENSGHIKKTENNLFVVEPTGYEIAATLEKSLPLSVRDKALESAFALLSKAKIQKENQVEIDKIENGYNVTCHISGGDFDLMKFTVYVPDYNQAKMVKNNFHKNPESLYKLLLTSITEASDIV